jgi:hypothetical protein
MVAVVRRISSFPSHLRAIHSSSPGASLFHLMILWMATDPQPRNVAPAARPTATPTAALRSEEGGQPGTEIPEPSVQDAKCCVTEVEGTKGRSDGIRWYLVRQARF